MSKATKLTIVERVVAILGLTDEGKVNAFFMKEEKKAKRAIEVENRNIVGIELNYKTQKEEANDKLEDLKQSLEEAKTAITPEDVVNNETMSTFASKYWENIFSLKGQIKAQEDLIEALAEEEEKTIKKHKETIENFQFKLDIIK